MGQLERYLSENGAMYLASEVIKRDIAKELTQDEYDALTENEKNNGTTYYITDGASSIITPSIVTPFDESYHRYVYTTKSFASPVYDVINYYSTMEVDSESEAYLSDAEFSLYRTGNCGWMTAKIYFKPNVNIPANTTLKTNAYVKNEEIGGYSTVISRIKSDLLRLSSRVDNIINAVKSVSDYRIVGYIMTGGGLKYQTSITLSESVTTAGYTDDYIEFENVCMYLKKAN